MNGGNIFAVTTDREERISQEDIDYVNNTLLVAWRDRGVKLDKARGVLEKRDWDEACQELGLPLETMHDKVPDEKRKRFRELCSKSYGSPEWLRPIGFEKPPLPPNLPQSLTAHLFIRRQGGDCIWESVNHEETTKLEIPPDPPLRGI